MRVETLVYIAADALTARYLLLMLSHPLPHPPGTALGGLILPNSRKGLDIVNHGEYQSCGVCFRVVGCRSAPSIEYYIRGPAVRST